MDKIAMLDGEPTQATTGSCRPGGVRRGEGGRTSPQIIQGSGLICASSGLSGPMVREAICKGAKVLLLDRLGEEGTGAHFVGALDILKGAHAGEDDEVEAAEFGPGAKPLEEFEAVGVWEAQVQHNDRRERELRAVGELALALKVTDGGMNRADDLDGVMDAGFLQLAFEEENIVGIILNPKDDFVAWRDL